jgi:WD40 repeat protein
VTVWGPDGLDPQDFWVTFSPDGKAVACAGPARGCLVEVRTGRALRPVPHCRGVVRFSPDGSKWATGILGRLELWDAGSGRPLRDLPDEFDFYVGATSADGRWFADRTYTHRDPRAIRIWDLASGRIARQFYLPEGVWPPTGLAFDPGGRTLTGLHLDGVVRRWGSGPGGGDRPVPIWGNAGWREGPTLYQLSPDGRQVAALVFATGTDRFSFGAGRRAGRLDVWDAGTGAVVHRHALPLPDWSETTGWLPDGSALLVHSPESSTCVDLQSGRAGVTFPATDLDDVSADSRLVAGGKRDPKREHGPLTVWEVATGRELLTVRTDDHRWRAAVAAGRRAVVVADGRFLRVVDLVTGADRGRRDLPHLGFGQHVDPPVRGALILPGDDRVLTALEDGTALVWDLTAFPPPRLADRHGEPELRAWWDELAGEDAARAYAAGRKLAEAPRDAVVAFLRGRVQPVRIDPAAVRQMVVALDSPAYEAREAAGARLLRQGPGVLPEVRKRPAGLTAEAVARLEQIERRLSGPVPPADTLRVLRAVGVLERVGTGDARRVLEDLARGADAAPETKAARAALGRMSRGWGRP